MASSWKGLSTMAKESLPYPYSLVPGVVKKLRFDYISSPPAEDLIGVGNVAVAEAPVDASEEAIIAEIRRAVLRHMRQERNYRRVHLGIEENNVT